MNNIMEHLGDQENRNKAINNIHQNILVEAGAGSGKTSVLTNRIIKLIANGVHPENIVAISFTEMAAGELLERINDYIYKINNNEENNYNVICKLSVEEKQTLLEMSNFLDSMTCTTIHGFCEKIIRPYPEESNIDPGAKIIDANESDLIFEDIMNKWLKENLTYENNNLLTFFVSMNVSEAIKLIKDIAYMKKENSTISVNNIDSIKIKNSFKELKKRVIEFEKFMIEQKEYAMLDTEAIVSDLKDMIEKFDLYLNENFEKFLSHALFYNYSNRVFTTENKFKVYKQKGKWEKSAGKNVGNDLNNLATDYYNNCANIFEKFISELTDYAISNLFKDIQPIIESYNIHKKKAALIDFEDLLYLANNLLNSYPNIRDALVDQYKHILIDEFQDTDSTQIDIMMKLTSKTANNLEEWIPNNGSLFLVGDPKQAIYRFRGADINSYLKVKKALYLKKEKNQDIDIINISTNFRSLPKILNFVNLNFDEPLSKEEQPGFVKLIPFRSDNKKDNILKIKIDCSENSSEQREEEAEKIAKLCQSLIGNYEIDENNGKKRLCSAKDIVLLAPTGTELWKFENALEKRKISVSSQAGKGLYRRQEIQEMIALTRAIADQNDTLALFSFLKGTFVGITDNTLLNLTYDLNLNREEDSKTNFIKINMNLYDIPEKEEYAYVKKVLNNLQFLFNIANIKTPYDILSKAIYMFDIKAILFERYKNPERSIANINRYIEISKNFDIKGISVFSDYIRNQWEENERIQEGKTDNDFEDSVSLITMHSAKGLEWPIVIPINTTTIMKKNSRILIDNSENKAYIPIGKFYPTEYQTQKEKIENEENREKIRLWYVCATRARNLLILPEYEKASDSSWSKIIQFKFNELNEVELIENSNKAENNEQNDKLMNLKDFEQYCFNVKLNDKKNKWIVPSRLDNMNIELNPEDNNYEDFIIENNHLWAFVDTKNKTVGSKERGIIIHKIMEELLNNELLLDNIENRSKILTEQLKTEKNKENIATIIHEEIKDTIIRTINIPLIKKNWNTLVPEFPVFENKKYNDNFDENLYGIVDAVSIVNNKPEIIIDWKTDISHNKQTEEQHKIQVKKYMETLNCTKGYIIYMTTQEIVEVSL